MTDVRTEELVEQLIELEYHDKLIGEFKNIPDSVYHHPDCPGLSASGLVTVGEHSYGHYLASKTESKKTPALEFGTAFHSMLLEPEEFTKRYCKELKSPKFDRRTKVGKVAYSEWAEATLTPWENANRGKKVLNEETFSKLIGMYEMATKNTTLRTSLLRGCLLYTSPSPRDRQKSRMPSSA